MGQRRGGFQRAGFRRAGTGGTASSGLASLTSSDGRVAIGNPSGPIADLTVPLIQAGWTQTITRVFAYDPINGNDANVGYADPATTSAADYAIACAAAGAAAKKTSAGIRGILPSAGASRQFELVVANGGVSTLANIAGDLNAAIGGITGYASWVVRTTGTNTTAGCVAFDGSAADCTYLGAITATGMNAAGYTPTGSPTTTAIQCLKTGGAAAGFAAEAATTMPLGARVRFDNTAGTTTQAALRNIVRQVNKVAGTDTLTFAVALPALPINTTDTFYIEMPGVNFATMSLANDVFIDNINTLGGFVAGFSTTTAIRISGGTYALAFCWAGTSFTSIDSRLAIAAAYTHTVRGSQTVGGNRTATSFATTNTAVNLSALLAGTTYTAINPVSHTATALVAGTAITFTGAYLPLATAAIGGTAAVVGTTPRLLNGTLTLNGPARVAIGQLSVNAAAAQCVVLAGTDSLLDLSVAGANTSLTGTGAGGGLSLNTSASRCSVRLDPLHLPAFAGPPEIILAGSINSSWAAVSVAGGLIDQNGNRFFVPQNATSQIKFSGTLFGGAGATFTYVADAGDALAVNNNTKLDYPAPGVNLSVLRVKPRVNTMTQACSVTLYKNGATTLQTVSIPAASTAVVSIFQPIQMQDGDSFDLRIDAAAADAAHTLAISATIACSA